MSRFARGLLGTALLGAGLQALALTGGDPRLNAAWASNILGICLAVLATSAAVVASRKPDRYARQFWLLTAAEVLSAYYDCVLHASVHEVWPSDVIYFLFPAPMALALFLRVRSRRMSG